jgi:5-methylcytosine-specific restriction endonuclease McrA
MTVTRRGTSNSGKNGSAAGRRARKRWLIQTYRADVDVLAIPYLERETPADSADLVFHLQRLKAEDEDQVVLLDWLPDSTGIYTVPQGQGEAACRCYRCGKLLWFRTLEVDRIHPGWKKSAKYPNGGTYVRENIRPACERCNKITGNEDRWKSHKPFRLLAELLAHIRGEET